MLLTSNLCFAICTKCGLDHSGSQPFNCRSHTVTKINSSFAAASPYNHCKVGSSACKCAFIVRNMFNEVDKLL